jgi:phospholipid/cholesterol/gamma-HCH transport system permease protein
MGVAPVTFLAATRLLAAWMVLPFMYMSAVGAGFFASYLAVVQQIGEVSSGGYFLIFWMFQNPPDLIFSLIKAMFMATAIVAVNVVDFFLSLAIWGATTTVRIAG